SVKGGRRGCSMTAASAPLSSAEDEVGSAERAQAGAVEDDRVGGAPGDEHVRPDRNEGEIGEVVDPGDAVELDLVVVREVGDVVVARRRLEDENILVVAAGQNVVAAAAIEPVLALAAVEHVVAGGFRQSEKADVVEGGDRPRAAGAMGVGD